MEIKLVNVCVHRGEGRGKISSVKCLRMKGRSVRTEMLFGGMTTGLQYSRNEYHNILSTETYSNFKCNLFVQDHFHISLFFFVRALVVNYSILNFGTREIHKENPHKINMC